MPVDTLMIKQKELEARRRRNLKSSGRKPRHRKSECIAAPSALME